MRGWAVLPTAWAACALPPVVEAEPSEAATIAEVWDGLQGTLLLEAVIASPRTADGLGFFIADPQGGPGSGLHVILGGVFDDLPPPVGTPIQLEGPTIQGTFGPGLLLRNTGDLVVLGPPVPLEPQPWSDDAQLEQALVITRDVQVTSALDPAGRASTDGPAGVGGLFGIGPGYARSGDLIGILTDGRISPRTAGDWSGSLEGDPPRSVELAELAALDDGTPVILHDLLQATPWDRSGRWALLQDPGGQGLWLDAESFGLWHHSDAGTVARWEGEVRHDSEGIRLRAWLPPTGAGSTRTPTRVALPADGPLADGALIETTVSGISAPDLLGERPTAEGPLLDDRFVSLEGLDDPAHVVAAVRGSDPARLAVLP